MKTRELIGQFTLYLHKHINLNKKNWGTVFHLFLDPVTQFMHGVEGMLRLLNAARTDACRQPLSRLWRQRNQQISPPKGKTNKEQYS